MLIKKTTGMSPTWFRDVFGQMSTLSQSTGYDCSTIQNGVELTDMFSIVPSDTYPTHATMYTGDPAGEHGMASMGGFVDRDYRSYGDGPEDIEYVNTVGFDYLVRAFRDSDPENYALDKIGSLDKYLIERDFAEESFLHRLGKDGYETMVAGNMYKLGRTRYQPPLWLSILGTGTKSAFISVVATSSSDSLVFDHARRDVEKNHSDLITIYTWNTDHIGHYQGMTDLKNYLTGQGDTGDKYVDKYIEDFWKDTIVENNLQKNAVFVLFDDHGRIEMDHDHQFVHYDPNAIDVFEITKFEFSENLGASFLQFGDDGSLLQVHLRDADTIFGAKDWSNHPPFNDVLNLAREISMFNKFQDYRNDEFLENPFYPYPSLQEGLLKYVFVTDHLDGNSLCCDNYCGVELQGAPGSTVAVPVDIDQYLSGGVLPVETTKERLKMLQGPDKKNSGNIILVLKTIGNEQSMTDPLEGYYFKDGDQVKLFQKKVYEWIIYAREKLYADYWLPDSIINMSPTALYDWVSNLTPDNAPSWLPKWAVNMVPHAHTVHGSLSTYESNTLFMVFYPYLNDHPSMRDDFKADLRAFLDDYTPEKTDLGGETPRFTTNHPDVFVHSIKNSNRLFMEQSTDGQ